MFLRILIMNKIKEMILLEIDSVSSIAEDDETDLEGLLEQLKAAAAIRDMLEDVYEKADSLHDQINVWVYDMKQT